MKRGEDATGVPAIALVGTSEPLRQCDRQHTRRICDRREPFSFRSAQSDAEGRAEKILILTDVTDRKLAEYALRTAERLAATGKLANAIAHEINNPLEALTNLIYLARSASSLEVAAGLACFRPIGELERIARITKQSLAFHRDSQVAIPIDMGKLVADVIALSERSAALRRVRLVYNQAVCDNRFADFPANCPRFLHLIRNAAEAAPPDTDVVVRVMSIHRGGRRRFAHYDP